MKKEYDIIISLISPNPYSRPQSKMFGIKGIAIHWVGNANSKAINNRNYFENLKNQTATPKRYASSHEIIGLDGEVVICLPKNEVGFHVGAKSYKPRVKTLLANSPNRYLYGIETCHPDWSGKFNDKTYRTLINRVADLLIEFDLKPSKDTLWRHFDVTGKDCPKYYIDNPKEWDKLVADIIKRYDEKINPKKEVIKMGSVFKDVDDNSWGFPYIKAAKELGIIDGVGDGNFNPKGLLTREQSAVLMVRLYEKITGKKVVK